MEVAMEYALMIYSEPGAEETLSDAERAAVLAGYAALADDDRCLDGTWLQPMETATRLRRAGGEVLLSDGPFADTKEVLGGFRLVEAADVDEALELAARVPAVRLGGTVEDRPVKRR
ncbi:YciI family protein [Streptomyces sp. NPDC057367]|uniref:YciI family protein n=1 Tax=Streptomyces sp. NPDC057367 TaxID=3346108 RepID=UPI0036325212